MGIDDLYAVIRQVAAFLTLLHPRDIFFQILNVIILKIDLEIIIMERIHTLETRNLCDSAKNGGCGECQTSCQSACKTSCGIANQQCENKNEK